MKANETETGTAGIPAGANATSRPNINIPQHILDHAERHYPASARPNCPIFSRNFDRDKQHCIHNRLQIEAEEAAKNPPPTKDEKSIPSIPCPQPQPIKLEAPKITPQPGKTTSPQQPSSVPTPVPYQSQTRPKTVTVPSQSHPSDGTSSQNTANTAATNESGSASASDADSDQSAIEEEIAASHEPLSPLDKLPADQQQLIYELLQQYSARSVSAAIAKPAPQGFNLKISHKALGRFLRRYKKRTHLQKKLQTTRIAYELCQQPEVENQGYAIASENLLNVRLLETINNPESKTAEIRDLYLTIIRLRAQDTAQQRLKLQERKLNQSS